jgi:hemolysin activation/secretion protein
MGRTALKIAVSIGFLMSTLNSSILDAQTVPSTAEPERLEQRFKKPVQPKSKSAPTIPETEKPIALKEMEKIRFVLKKINIEGSTVYAQNLFNRWQKNILNKNVSLALIYKFAEKITKKYRDDGYLLSRAIVIPQEIENGEVTIQVIQGHIGNILVRGPIVGTKAFIKASGKQLLQSSPLLAKDLERYLLLIDDLPGVTVESVLLPSKDQPGASELILSLKHKKYGANGGIDNRGSKFNGPVQLKSGASANSTLGFYEKLGIQGIMTSQPDELQYLSGFGEFAVSTEGTKLSVTTSISRSEPGASLKVYQVEGESNTFSLGLSHPFIRSRKENLKGSLNITSRNSQTKLLGEILSKDNLRVIDFGFSYDFLDRFFGVNIINATLSKGLDMFGATETGSSNLSRSDGHSDFTKLSGDLLRLQQLGEGWSLLTSLTWQYAFERLLSSEEFGLGGPQLIRAYNSSEITGDQGYGLKFEIQKGIKTDWDYLKSYQPYFYIDHGSVFLKNPSSTSQKEESLTALGLGTRGNITDWLSGYIEIGLPLSKDVGTEGNKNPRAFFGLTAHY